MGADRAPPVLAWTRLEAFQLELMSVAMDSSHALHFHSRDDTATSGVGSITFSSVSAYGVGDRLKVANRHYRVVDVGMRADLCNGSDDPFELLLLQCSGISNNTLRRLCCAAMKSHQTPLIRPAGSH
jgi:hypothetical protein